MSERSRREEPNCRQRLTIKHKLNLINKSMIYLIKHKQKGQNQTKTKTGLEIQETSKHKEG